MTSEDLASPAILGPAVATATGDDRWLGLESTLIAGGKSNLTYLLSSEAGELVLRRPPSGHLLAGAHDMPREARIQQALADSSVPVPAIVWNDPQGEALGVPAYVMQKVEGHIIRAELPPGYANSVAEKQLLSDALIDTLASLHTLDPAAVGLHELGRPDGYLRRQLDLWKHQWESSRTREVTAIEELASRLETQLPVTRRHTIVHGDYRMDNCVLDPHDPSRVAAVLDWEMSTLGDPLTDLGMLLFFWRLPGETMSSLTPSATIVPGFPDRQHLVARYASRTGADVEALPFYEAFAHYKFAVIVQGIAARVASGAMAGQDFGDLESEVVQIAEQGLDLATTSH